MNSQSTQNKKKKYRVDMVSKIGGCNPSTRISKILHDELHLSLVEECEKLINCALNTEKQKTKIYCLEQFDNDMSKKYFPQAKKWLKIVKGVIIC